MSSPIYTMLLGKTGAGKSKTGNTILDRNAFVSKPSMESVTWKSQKELTELDDGRKLYVVDLPGVADTRGTLEQGKKLFMNAAREAVMFSPSGYHAMIFVLRFGERFTDAEANVVHYLNLTFGPDFMGKHGIIVMSFGDNFARAKEDGEIGDVTFTEWCEQQTGRFQDLVSAANGRILLFNNYGSADEKLRQRRDLVAMIDGLNSDGQPYTSDQFKEARKHYGKLLQSQEINELAKNALEQLSIILYEKERRYVKNDDARMKKLMDRVSCIHDALKNAQKRTERLDQLQAVFQKTRDQIEAERTILKMAKDLEGKKNAGAEVQGMKSQLYKLRDSTSRNNADLTKEYQKIRDDYNGFWASLIWGLFESVFGQTAVNWFRTEILIPLFYR